MDNSADKQNNTTKLITVHGGYGALQSYQMAEIGGGIFLKRPEEMDWGKMRKTN